MDTLNLLAQTASSAHRVGGDGAIMPGRTDYYRLIPPVEQGEPILVFTKDGIRIKSDFLDEEDEDTNQIMKQGFHAFAKGQYNDVIPYEDIKQFDVYDSCFTTTFFGRADQYGNILQEEKVKIFNFDPDDDRSISSWLDWKNLLLMWSRQSNVSCFLLEQDSRGYINELPIFEKRVPKVIFHTRIPMGFGGKKIDPDSKLGTTRSGNAHIKPLVTNAYNYHDDVNELLKQNPNAINENNISRGFWTHGKNKEGQKVPFNQLSFSSRR